MNREYELELLRAFADSKNYEFSGFQVQYKLEHPEPEDVLTKEEIVDVEEAEKEIVEGKAETFDTAEEMIADLNDESVEPEVVEEPEEKPKSKKKAADKDASA